MPASKTTAKKTRAKKTTASKSTGKRTSAGKATAKTSSVKGARSKKPATKASEEARPGNLIIIDSPQVGSPPREGEILKVAVGAFSVSSGEMG